MEIQKQRKEKQKKRITKNKFQNKLEKNKVGGKSTCLEDFQSCRIWNRTINIKEIYWSEEHIES